MQRNNNNDNSWPLPFHNIILWHVHVQPPLYTVCIDVYKVENYGNTTQKPQ